MAALIAEHIATPMYNVRSQSHAGAACTNNAIPAKVVEKISNVTYVIINVTSSIVSATSSIVNATSLIVFIK